MEKKKLKLTISGSPKKTISNIELLDKETDIDYIMFLIKQKYKNLRQ